MTRFRIVKRGSFLQPGVPVFDVEEYCWLWWEPRGTFESLAAAELRVADLMATAPIERQVVKKYN